MITKANLLLVAVFCLLFCVLLLGCQAPYGDGSRQAMNEELRLYYLAINTADIRICADLDPRASQRPKGVFDYETKTFDLKDSCFFNIAINTKNNSLCYKISDKYKNPDEDLSAYQR